MHRPFAHAARDKIDELSAELAGGKIGRVDDGAGAVADRLQQLPLALDGLQNGRTVAHQGVQAARLLKALDDDLGAGLNEENRVFQMHFIELVERLKQRVERHAASHIRHQRDLFISSLSRKTQARELRNHLRRHVVHTVKAEVLQIGRGSALSRAGKTRNDNKLHSLLLLPDPNLRLEAEHRMSPILSSAPLRSVFFTSSAVAPPVFTTKPACFFDTPAPPTPKPLSPACSMSAPA